MKMKNTETQDIFLRYPYCGQIVSCIDREFGYVSGPTGVEMIHLSDLAGQHLETMEGLVRRRCGFVVGGNPFLYSQMKTGWDQSIVQWKLIDELKSQFSPKAYHKAREEKLQALDNARLYSFLAAEWYVELWQKKTGKLPKVPLVADKQLESVLRARLAESDGIDNLVHLLAAICDSPWYSGFDSDRREIYTRFFRPEDWPISVFRGNCSRPAIRGSDIIWNLCEETLQAHNLRTRTIAIDLESNKESIFQIGWKNATGTHLRTNQKGLSRIELHAAFRECLSGQKLPCIVGHNLLSWDLPILQTHDLELPEKSEIWDTLIVSWILEPWREFHALVVKEHAHRADADAEACYDLFLSQVELLLPCLEGFNRDIHALVDRLYDEPSRLSMVCGRDYPSSLSETSSVETLYPSSLVNEIAWQKGCHIELVAPENRLSDPVLSPEICRQVAQLHPDLLSKVVSVVVSDAASNHVEVRLSFLPGWLVDDELRETLKEAHLDVCPTSDENMRTFYLAEDLFKLGLSEIEAKFSNGSICAKYPDDVAVVWQKMRGQQLKEADVREKYPDVIERRASRALLPVQKEDGVKAWLLYEPPGLTSGNAPWTILPNLPEWLPGDSDGMKNPEELYGIVQIPRWRDGGAARLDLDRLFLSPDTANRPLYLSDVLHCILNLRRAYEENIIIFIGMKWREEAAWLQGNIVKLGLSVPQSGSPLRHLERIHQKGHRVLACDLEELKKYIHSADRLGVIPLVVVSEVPLHDWYALLHEPEVADKSSPDMETSDAVDYGSDEDESLSDDDVKHEPTYQHVVLRGKDIRESLSRYLTGWVQGLVGSLSASSPGVLILDARLTAPHVAKMIQVARHDVPFYAIEEILDLDLQRVFNLLCCSCREDIPIPNDYEDYRLFLKENWGYEDFRSGTQRPAIEKFIGTDRDILLRLPTGAGKSIIFHLPALFRSHYSGRLTIVITPLRALMNDQVEGLWRHHFTESVDYLSGGRDAWLNYEVYQGVLDGRIRLLFVAPERFRVSRFVEALERRRRMDGALEFVVFDEAHCISEWGFEFRPDYLFAAQYVAEWFKKKDLPGNPHRLLLTSATITERNRTDLEKELNLGPEGSYENLPEDMPHPIQPFIELESFDLYEDEESPSDEKFEKITEILTGLNLKESAALVFVRRRKDCHRISDSLNAYAAGAQSDLPVLHALPFHAGLPETVKAEACDLLRNRKANVLVCTKAFGMGMDIPHLHACIHHRPPTFIEDYLQEVGRIGRDENERLRAGHEHVTATLLYNQNDMERNLALLHDKTVKPPDLQDFFAFCLEEAQPFPVVGRSLRIVPSKVRINETKTFEENQVTNCLFWLERMRVLRIEGRHPPFLDFILALPKLRRHAKGTTLASRIARLLIDVLEDSQNVVRDLTQAAKGSKSTPEAEGAFGRVIKGILRGVLALIPHVEPVKQGPDASKATTLGHSESEGGAIHASISMSELMSRCGEISIDDLFSGLFELSKARALTLCKTFVVTRNSAPSGDKFWNLLQRTLDRLLQPTQGKVELINRKDLENELRKWYHSFLSEPKDEAEAGFEFFMKSELLKRQINREVYRAINTSIRILRYAGLEVRETISEEGMAQYACSVPKAVKSSIAGAGRESIKSMKTLLNCISNHESQADQARKVTFEVLLTDIMEELGPEVRLGRLRELMKLLETSGFYGFDGALNDWVFLVSLNRQEKLESYTPESTAQSSVQDVYKEMLEKYELQVLRAQAMVLFAAMPPENRKNYIDRYFECMKADEINNLLEDTVGDVDDQVIASNPMLMELLSQVRKERFTEEIDKLNENQLAVCKAPFDQTLLVNAGPGSGKTRVLIMRCAHLIHSQGIDPAEILVLAFNRAVVYEIRDRIRTLFRALGYGRYGNRLDVSTFHSFALSHQKADDIYDEDAIGEAVHRFAEALQTNKAFAQSIGGRYKAVLVDEFQDMDEDFYSVVKALVVNCSGGGMIIGDDDQDILTWKRRQWRRQYKRECSPDATYYFRAFRESLATEEHSLILNYRSVTEIVEPANGMIEKVSDRIDFKRMKDGLRLSVFRDEHGSMKKLVESSRCPELVEEALTRGESVAVLCRTNRECQQIYKTLVERENVGSQNINILGVEDFPLHQLRHCGALQDICKSRKGYEFVEPYIWDELLQEYDQIQLADSHKDRDYLADLYTLVREEVGRPRIRDLISFIQEMRISDIERLKAKAGLTANAAEITVATVHKVKGLEYDTVFILPSSENFPLRWDENGDPVKPDHADSVEEARLCYVAMTRARNHLYVGLGERERAWFLREQYIAGEHAPNYRMTGSPKELFVSWPGREEQVKERLQDYIGSRVCVGDSLVLRRCALMHDKRIIGYLSTKTRPKLEQCNPMPQLRVSNVIRYTCGQYFREHKPKLWGPLHDSVKRQGWFYVVLAEEA